MENNRTKIFLIRHGEVANAADRCYNGHNDVDLSADGLKQMEKIADRLKGEPLKAVYSSDLQRAAKGARLISERHSVEPVSIKELRELSYGIWEGKRVEDIKNLYPEEFRARYDDILNYRIQNGETLLEMRERVLPAVKGIINKHTGDSIAIVAHAGVIKILLLWSLNMDLRDFYRIQQDYAALNIISFYDNGSAVVELMNG